MFCLALVLLAILGTLSVASGSTYFASSDDSGKYLAAALSDYGVIVSSDYGSTWNTTKLGTGPWGGFTSDGTGKKLFLSYTVGNTSPHFSVDQGATWAFSTGAIDSYYGIACDGTGTKVITAGALYVYTSTNGGSSYTQPTSAYSAHGTAVAYSADGSTQVYSISEYIVTAVNGVGKVTPSAAANWDSLSTDATGKVIAGAYSVGYYAGAGSTKAIQLSLDGGSTFATLVTNTGATTYYTVLVTDDASLLFYFATDGLYQYNLAKKTTTKSTFAGGNFAMAASKTGKYVVATSVNAIFVSSDYGINFKQTKFFPTTD